MADKLIFVYNAKSGLFSGAIDLVHKTFRPASYPCKLCAVTYFGPIMKPNWKRFTNSLGVKTEFLHVDEYEKKYKSKTNYPVVLAVNNDKFSTLITNKEFEKVKSLDDLKQVLRSKL